MTLKDDMYAILSCLIKGLVQANMTTYLKAGVAVKLKSECE